MALHSGRLTVVLMNELYSTEWQSAGWLSLYLLTLSPHPTASDTAGPHSHRLSLKGRPLGFPRHTGKKSRRSQADAQISFIRTLSGLQAFVMAAVGR